MISKPIRERVEVLVRKPTGELLITVNVGDTDPIWYGFPGGGIEPGQSLQEAAIAETGEEVRCTIEPTEVIYEFTTRGYVASAGKKHREEQYAGARTRFVLANLVEEDVVWHTSDDDETEYQWMSVADAHALFVRASATQKSAVERIKVVEQLL